MNYSAPLDCSCTKAATSVGVAAGPPLARNLQMVGAGRHHVRPMLLFVALTLAANPAAMLLCDTWCDLVQPSLHAQQTCAHPRMAGARTHVAHKMCGAADEIVVAVLKNDTERVASTPVGRAVMARFSGLQVIANAGRPGVGATPPAVNQREVSTTLRL